VKNPNFPPAPGSSGTLPSVAAAEQRGSVPRCGRSRFVRPDSMHLIERPRCLPRLRTAAVTTSRPRADSAAAARCLSDVLAPGRGASSFAGNRATSLPSLFGLRLARHAQHRPTAEADVASLGGIAPAPQIQSFLANYHDSSSFRDCQIRDPRFDAKISRGQKNAAVAQPASQWASPAQTPGFSAAGQIMCPVLRND